MRFLTSRFICHLLILTLGSAATGLQAQQEPRYRYDSTLPPGAIGQTQLLRRSAMRGYAQPVELIAPQGARVWVFADGEFQDMGDSKATVGMFLGQVYRVKVTGIEGYPGLEVYPSIEVINRLYPPDGLELKFPVQVDLNIEDLVTAANGAIVTRVVYLEDPQDALPVRQQRHEQPYYDVAPHRDPLKVAQQLGRPMAVVRTGSRIPDPSTIEGFTFGGPPVLFFNQSQIRTQPQQEIPQQEIPQQGVLQQGVPNELGQIPRTRLGGQVDAGEAGYAAGTTEGSRR